MCVCLPWLCLVYSLTSSLLHRITTDQVACPTLCYYPSVVQVFALLSHESAHKLLILAGQSVEESGELLFHKGLFSPHQLKQILIEQVHISLDVTLHAFSLGNVVTIRHSINLVIKLL